MDAFEEAALRRARELGLRPPTRGAVLFLWPTFHPALAVVLEDLGGDGWWLQVLGGVAQDRLGSLVDELLPAERGGGLFGDLANAAVRPRRHLGGTVRDGIGGAAWVNAGRAIELGGHFALLGPEDPLHHVTARLLDAVEARVPGPVAVVRSHLRTR